MRFGLLLAICLLVSAPVSAQSYEKGLSAAQRGDYATALSEWRPMAESGDMRAQYGIGLLYRNGGAGVEKDDVQAAQWFEKSAAQGFAVSQRLIGAFYASGRGVEKDLATARKWFLAAAKQDDGFAQFGLALMLYRGEGGAKDPVGSLEWMSRAADRLPPGRSRDSAIAIRERGVEIIQELIGDQR